MKGLSDIAIKARLNSAYPKNLRVGCCSGNEPDNVLLGKYGKQQKNRIEKRPKVSHRKGIVFVN